MKIAIKDLKPNPFRHFDHYPINPEKVETLIASIKDTEFWGNIEARPQNGHYEIAYGHHRLEAIRKLGIKEIDIIVRKLSDHDMIKRMANENMETWKTDMNVIRETVRVAKEFLDKHPEVCSKYYKPEGIGHGLGRTGISNFLGGPWLQKYQQDLISEALAQLRDVEEEVVNEEHLQKLPSYRKSQAIRKAVKKTWKNSQGEYVPPHNAQEKKEREKIVARVVDRVASSNLGSPGKRDDEDIPVNKIEEIMLREKLEADSKKVKKPDKDPQMVILEKHFNKLVAIFKTLSNKLMGFLAELEKLNVENMSGVTSLIGKYEMAELLKGLRQLWDFLGYGRKQINEYVPQATEETLEEILKPTPKKKDAWPATEIIGIMERKQIDLGEKQPEQKSKLQVKGEEAIYISKLEDALTMIPTLPLTHFTEDGFKRAKTLVSLIVKRLRRFEDGQE